MIYVVIDGHNMLHYIWLIIYLFLHDGFYFARENSIEEINPDIKTYTIS